MKLSFQNHDSKYWEKCTKGIEYFIKNQVAEFHRDGVIIGLSGGIDSAIITKLAVNSLGPEKVKILLLPEKDSPKQNLKDAQSFARDLGISDITLVDISKILSKLGTYKLYFPLYLFPKFLRKKFISIKQDQVARKNNDNLFLLTLKGPKEKELAKGHAYYSSKTRTRMLVIYFYAELHNLLVLGTSNKSELLLGYFIKYGDSATDIMPILSFYKTELFDMARYLEIPDNIINKPPSSDLIIGITDEGSLGLTYEKADRILLGVEKNLSEKKISELAEVDIENVRFIKELVTYSKHMRELPPQYTLNE